MYNFRSLTGVSGLIKRLRNVRCKVNKKKLRGQTIHQLQDGVEATYVVLWVQSVLAQRPVCVAFSDY
jgi:hypothetical protein